MAELSPMMEQYKRIKELNKDSILFYRLGDFYEMFFEDAIVASKELELALTGRDCGQPERAPMCGVPFHSCETYIAKLVENGHKVAICEQVEDPATVKGIVRREVIRIVTPGTVIESNMLDEGKNNFIVALTLFGNTAGISYADCSTGEIVAGEHTTDKIVEYITAELTRLEPAEVLLAEELKQYPAVIGCVTDRIHAACEFITDKLHDNIALTHFKAESFASLGLEGLTAAQNALSNLLNYLYATQMSGLQTLHTLRPYADAGFMRIDPSTRRNLEITENLRTKERRGSILGVIDRTCTAMGKRMIRAWLEQPLLDIVTITDRQNAVHELIERSPLRAELRSMLTGMLDIERLMSRVVYGSANARDLISIRNILERLPDFKRLLDNANSRMLGRLNASITTLPDIYELLIASINDDAPVTVREGKMIRDGYSTELDELRFISKNGRAAIAKIEEDEREKTGIKTLKIGYNRVFGYYIEISKSASVKAPEGYIRKQTLANAERYITDSLKDWESKVLGAQERITSLEYELFSEVRNRVADSLSIVQCTAGALAAVDALCSMAEVSARNRYCLPTITNSNIIDIKGGRHPVVEDISKSEPFVPNDTLLDGDANRTIIITGPNMAGKSTYMRQVAAIVLLAQMGMYVPAASATVGITDSIFTRVGASDDLASGDSTFMVEMKEVAYILSNATEHSLVIFDEIGRGTSTFDGMAIARAAIEYTNGRLKSKALFATHYHELTELEGKMKGVKNYNITVKKRGEDVIFLRKLVRGAADQSLGIEIAKMAGVPAPMLKRAREILRRLQESEIASIDVHQNNVIGDEPEDMQTLFSVGELTYGSDIIERLCRIEADTLSPIEAMNELYKLCTDARKSREMQN